MNGRFAAGDIVLADWRDALPKEPNKRRPAIVVEALWRVLRWRLASGRAPDNAPSAAIGSRA